MSECATCRTCGSDGRFNEHDAREMLFGSRERFSYLECGHCKSLQIQAVPPDLERHYPPDYLGNGQPFEHARVVTVRSAVRDFLQRQRTAHLIRGRNPLGWLVAKLRADELTPHLRALRPARIRNDRRILDVGCGPGYLLRRLRQSGYRHAVGQDPFQQWTVSGVAVHRGDLDGLTGQFDVIMLHHSLEHTPDPLTLLVVLKRLAAPGGLILVRVPVAASAAWREYGVDWYQIDAPRHLVIPSAMGIKFLARRAGLEVVRQTFDSNETQFLCSEQYRRDIPLRDARSYYQNPSQSLFSQREVAKAKARAQEVNMKQEGDQGCFYLRAAA